MILLTTCCRAKTHDRTEGCDRNSLHTLATQLGLRVDVDGEQLAVSSV
ncbi:hypothetical protein F4693_002194 [Sphingomonas endophytica]|uniref:Uncharacterized protein n=1 Tax=Sphingomonas endophytica TaxID=869719 RepID=A0A7X0JEB9_9SPHN|nr:hypothetical protein [Sphingomonas endophytica]